VSVTQLHVVIGLLILHVQIGGWLRLLVLKAMLRVRLRHVTTTTSQWQRLRLKVLTSEQHTVLTQLVQPTQATQHLARATSLHSVTDTLVFVVTGPLILPVQIGGRQQQLVKPAQQLVQTRLATRITSLLQQCRLRVQLSALSTVVTQWVQPFVLTLS
jgi:hypothetical protein